MDDLDGVF